MNKYVLLMLLTFFQSQQDIDSIKYDINKIYTKQKLICPDYERFSELLILSDTNINYLKIFSGEEGIYKYSFLARSVENVRNGVLKEVICINEMLFNIAVSVKHDAELSALIGQYIGLSAHYNFCSFVEVLADYDQKHREIIMYKLDYIGNSEIIDSIISNIDNYDRTEHIYIISELKDVMNYIVKAEF